MKLKWVEGTGPDTTQELADEIEVEGRLGHGHVSYLGERCLWGVIGDWPLSYSPETFCARRFLSPDSAQALVEFGLGVFANVSFEGTPEERCAEMTRRLRAIP